ncbi:hypothetical protein [Streptomyces sp. NBC_00035]|uniref:hypothetical protein n=1 Tax=Streptomyces sp. NBC_00035 TaxID=2903614 RepID=UPI003248FEFA
MDGTYWDVADTEANQAAFGRPGNGRGTGFASVALASIPLLVLIVLRFSVDMSGWLKSMLLARGQYVSVTP